MELTDITWEDGENNTAGIQPEILFAPIADIEVLPKPILSDPTSDGSFSDLVTITGNIIMKPGKTFKKMYVTLNEGGIVSEEQGETDGKSFKNTLSFLHPGSKPDILGFAAWSKNASLIWLVPEADGQLRMLGTAAYPAKSATAKADTGKKPSDRKAATFTFESDGAYPSPIFPGVILDSYSGSGLVTVETETIYME